MPENIIAADRSVFVFRPGGTHEGNVFTTWADCYAALSQSNGRRWLQIDDSLGAASVPAGTYDLKDVVLLGPYNKTDRALLTLEDGVVFQNLRRIEGFLKVDHVGSAPVMTDLSGSDLLQCEKGPCIQCSGTAPFARIDTAGPMDILGIFLIGAQIINNGHEVLELNNAAAIGYIGCDLNSVIGENSLRGLVGSLYSIQVSDGASDVNWIHANHAGTILPRYPWYQLKSGSIEASAFSGSPPQATVTFNAPYIDDQYHVSFTVEAINGAVFNPTIVSRVAGNFVVALNGAVNTANLTRVTWSIQGRYSEPQAT